MAAQITTEKSRGNATVTGASRIRLAPAGGSRCRDYRRRGFHRQDAEGPRASDEQESMGDEVQEVRGAGRRERAKEELPWVRKARAEVAAYADCTESQMMAMFGRTDPKTPAHYIAPANREKLGISGMEKIVAFDQSQSLDDLLQLPEANRVQRLTGTER
jgi:hypothetical protein